MKRGSVDVTVVIPFSDDEERVGRLGQRLAEHLRALALDFEILLVDEDSVDNSVALLSLLRHHLPELRIVSAPGRGQGFLSGARVARGRALLLFDVDHVDAPLSPLGGAISRVLRGSADVIAYRKRFVVCHRVRTAQVLFSLRGRGAVYERRLLRRTRSRHLTVETPRPTSVTGPITAVAPARGVARFLDSFLSARFQGLLRSRA